MKLEWKLLSTEHHSGRIGLRKSRWDIVKTRYTRHVNLSESWLDFIVFFIQIFIPIRIHICLFNNENTMINPHPNRVPGPGGDYLDINMCRCGCTWIRVRRDIKLTTGNQAKA